MNVRCPRCQHAFDPSGRDRDLDRAVGRNREAEMQQRVRKKIEFAVGETEEGAPIVIGEVRVEREPT
jgi:hypothetical protein